MRWIADRFKFFLRVFYLMFLATIIVGACRANSQTTTAVETPPAASQPAATSPARQKAVTIDVWFHAPASPQGTVLKQGLREFNLTRKDIQIELIELPEETYDQQVQAAAYGAAIAGDLPCLLDFDGPYTYHYVWKGFLIPLDKYLSAEMKADFLPSVITQGTFQDGKLYSLGQYEAGLAIWGNRAYLEQAGVRLPTVQNPWNREEFEAALAALQALPGTEYALDMKMNYPVDEFFTYGFSTILQSFGADLIDRATYQSAEGVLNGPEAVAAMEMVQGWFEQGYANPNPTGDTDFTEGKTALSWVGHWAWAPYRDALGDQLLLLPMPDFGHGPKTGLGSWSWGITASCDHPDEAWQVLAYILAPELMVHQSEAAGTIPARKSALAQSQLYGPGDPLHLYLQQYQAGFAVPRPITPAYPTISRAFAEAFRNIANGAEVQVELDKAVEKIDQDVQAHYGYPIP